MEFNSRREARFVLIKDQLNAVAARLGFLKELELNQVGEVSVGDGYIVDIRSSTGIGNRIQHTMHVEVDHPSWDNPVRFTVDVLGKNQCKNCYFPDLPNFGKDVDSVDEDVWDDLKYLPEIFSSAVEELIYTRFKTK